MGKKIKVAFDMDTDDFNKIVQGLRGKKLTDAEVNELSKKDLVHAADFIKETDQPKGFMSSVSGEFSSGMNETGNQAKTGMNESANQASTGMKESGREIVTTESDPEAQHVTVEVVVETVVA